MQTPDEEEEKLNQVYDNDSEDSVEKDLNLGIMGIYQRAFLSGQLIDMGFETLTVAALMNHSLSPIENVDQAIEIMFNPMRHRFYAGPDVTDLIAARVNRGTRNCQICFTPESEHRQDRLEQVVGFIPPLPDSRNLSLDTYVNLLKKES